MDRACIDFMKRNYEGLIFTISMLNIHNEIIFGTKVPGTLKPCPFGLGLKKFALDPILWDLSGALIL